jgi:hypothetical protein
MKGSALFGILVVSILIMGGSFYYFHAQDQKILPKYSISLDFKDNLSFNASYPITLSGVPSGSGTYQQLITIKDPSKYGINANGSNIAFYDGSNQTELYAWEQTINSTAIQVWVKNYNGSSTIDMRVLPFNKNLFNATSYLGEAPQLSATYGQYDNGIKVFPYYENYSIGQNISSAHISIENTGTVTFKNELIVNSTNYERLMITEQFPGGTYYVYVSQVQSGGYLLVWMEAAYSVNSTFGSYINTPSIENFYDANSSRPYPAFSAISPYDNLTIQWSFVEMTPNGIMPTFTIGSAYHPLSSFSISSNSFVLNTTFMEHNLTGYQYYAFSPIYEGNPVWFVVNGQVGDRLSVLLDSNVSLTVQILGYSYSNVIKEVKVE